MAALFHGQTLSVASAARDAAARDTEVDFLLVRDGDFVAIEAKASARIHDRHLAGLRAVAPLPRLRRRILTCPGERRMRSPDGSTSGHFAIGWKPWKPTASGDRSARSHERTILVI